MVVCRFFQQGYCRYGQNCRFEHVYGSKFSYHANPTPQVPSTQPSGCTDEQLVNQVQTDIQSALRGGQWILSCYSPFKEKAIFPDINDLSPEEARLFVYEAKNSNNIEQAVNYMNNLFKEVRQKYEQLLQPSVDVIKVLRSLYKGENVTSPFSNGPQNSFSSSDNTASSIFRSAVQQTQPLQNSNMAASIFSQGQQSIFNTQPDPAKDLFSRANNTSIFNQNVPLAQPNEAKSIFSSAVQKTNRFNTTNQMNPNSIFSSANQSIFGAQPTQTSSPFGQLPSSSPFGQSLNNSPFGQTQSNSLFGQPQSNSPFNQAVNTSPFSQGSVFQKSENPASIFGQANSQLNSTNELGIYSNLEVLDETDLDAFKSNRFELGFVPEVPPPQQLCV